MILDNCQCGSTLFLDLSHHKGNPIKSSQNKHNFQQNCIAPWSTLGPPCFTLPGTPCTGCGYMDLLSAIAASSCTVESSGCAFASGRNWHGNTYQAHGDGLGWVGWAGWAGMKVRLGLALETTLSCLRAIRRYSVASRHARSLGVGQRWGKFQGLLRSSLEILQVKWSHKVRFWYWN